MPVCEVYVNGRPLEAAAAGLVFVSLERASRSNSCVRCRIKLSAAAAPETLRFRRCTEHVSGSTVCAYTPQNIFQIRISENRLLP